VTRRSWMGSFPSREGTIWQRTGVIRVEVHIMHRSVCMMV
jgi:hypothetical protein